MKIFILFTCLIFLYVPGFSAQQADFYVSPAGNDQWSGTLGKANQSNTDGPFKTLLRARDAVRELKKRKKNDITVYLREGVYPIQETIVFDLNDSGQKHQKIIYQAFPGETPEFSSGIRLTDWKKADRIKHLPEKAQGKVWMTRVPEAAGLFYTLYDDDSELPRARSKGFKPPIDALGRDNKEHLRSRSKLYYPEGTVIRQWENMQDVELVIRPYALWIMNILPVKSVDEDSNILTTTIPGTYWLTKERFFRFPKESAWIENVIDALDQPGEWVFNSQNRTLYLWPKTNQPGDHIFVPTLKEFIRIEGDIDYKGPTDIPVKNIVLKDLCFKHADRDTWTATDKGIQHDWEMHDKGNAIIRLRGAENCEIIGCELTSGGGAGIRLDLYAQNNLVENCYIHHLGGTGIFLGGYGPGTKDVNKKNTIFNNKIHDCGRHYWHNAAITIFQSGENRIAHNLMYNMPYNAMSICGVRTGYFREDITNDNEKKGADATTTRLGRREQTRLIRWHEIGNLEFTDNRYVMGENLMNFIHSDANRIENNEIHNALQMLGDGNGIYISDTGPFNIIQANYLHDMSYAHGAAIRTDAYQRETLVAENIIFNCSAGVQLSNRDAGNNHAINNLIVNIKDVDPDRFVKSGLYYSSKPSHIGTSGVVQRNVVYHAYPTDPKFELEAFTRQSMELIPSCLKNNVDYNLIYCAQHEDNGQAILDAMQALGLEQHSLVADPMIQNIDDEDFRLKPNSPAFKIGFKQLDVSSMGLTLDFPEKYR